VRDPRVNSKDNEDYIDMMEDYFQRTGELFYSGEKCEDFKPEYHYLVGATPEFVEKARDHSERREKLNLIEANQPQSPM